MRFYLTVRDMACMETAKILPVSVAAILFAHDLLKGYE